MTSNVSVTVANDVELLNPLVDLAKQRLVLAYPDCPFVHEVSVTSLPTRHVPPSRQARGQNEESLLVFTPPRTAAKRFAGGVEKPVRLALGAKSDEGL